MHMTPSVKIMFMVILSVILLVFQVLTTKTEQPAEPMQNTTNAVVEIKNNDENLSNGPILLEPPFNDDYRVRQYDYNKIYNVLEQPARRVDRGQLPPQFVKRLIDYPTRGYADDFQQLGTLKKLQHHHHRDVNSEHEHEHVDLTNTNNFIIRLFGRAEFPSSNKYEYYTMINNGLDQIKIPIYVKRQELYEGDEIFIKELEHKYVVSLYKYDEPKYYPDLMY